MDEIREFFQRYTHFFQGLALAVLGLAVGWVLGRWRRHRLKRQLYGGDVRELVAIEQTVVREHPDGRITMRIRSCGSAPLSTIIFNPLAREAFLKRAEATKPTNPLLALHDKMGSYLLYLLQPWVCGLCRSGPFPHDVWVMAPVCEPGLLSEHQSTTVILVRQEDLKYFRDWQTCRQLHVEHGSDGARLLTLWHVAREFDRQLAEVKRLREQGKPTTYVETMYLLDLGLDQEEVPLRTKAVPWQRFAKVLQELGLS
jgi:hypothetical protein